jgi:hypothetical protein
VSARADEKAGAAALGISWHHPERSMDRKKKGSRPAGKAPEGKGLARPKRAQAPTDEALEPVRRPWLAPLVSSVGLLVLYVATLAPSVVGGDSGELTAAAVLGGVPHPPGFPVFAILARLFAALPFGPCVAWRVNLLSAVSTAAAAGVLCAVAQRLSGSMAAGFLAAALFGTNPIVWHNATAAEVFGLNAFFVALALWLWQRIERQPTSHRVFALCLASGLAMGNHHTFVFVGVPLLLRSWWVARRELRARGVVVGLGCGLLGLLPYAYLMIASSSRAPLSWGDQSTIGGLFSHFLRRDYGTFGMGHASATSSVFLEAGTFLPTLYQMLGGALRRLLFVGPLLAAIGLLWPARNRRQRTAVRIVLGIFLGYTLLFAGLSNLSTAHPLYRAVLSRFFIQSDLLLALAAGLGFSALFSRMRARGLWAHWLPGLALSLCLLTFPVGVAANAQAGQRHNTVLRDFVAAAFAAVPPNAIVITMGDHLSGAVFYLHEVEKLRPDTIHLDRNLLSGSWYCQRVARNHPDLVLPKGVYVPGGWTMRQLMLANPLRPLVIVDRLETWDESWKDGFKLAPTGLTHALIPAASFPSFEQWVARDHKVEAAFDPKLALRFPPGSWEHMAGELALNNQVLRAQLALSYSQEMGNAEAPARLGVRLLEEVLRLAGGSKVLGIAGEPGISPLAAHPTVLKSLGVGYDILSHKDPTFVARAAEAFDLFVQNASTDDQDLPAARVRLQRLRGNAPAAAGR